MRKHSRHWWKGISLVSVIFFTITPQLAFAGSLFVSVSPNNIDTLARFDVTMTSSGMTACTWSRRDNDTVWAWRDEPIPGGANSTTYDSGPLTGWSGPATYEWFFDCNDNGGGTYAASARIGIAASQTEPIPRISISPALLSYASTNLGDYRDLVIQVTNVGDIGSMLSGRASVISGPDFSCVLGCDYTNIPFWGTKNVTIRFAPIATPGAKSAVLYFTGGGDVNANANGTATGIPPPPPPPPPAPTVIVNPPSGNVPNVASWNVDMTPNGNVVACEYFRTSVAYGDFDPASLPPAVFTTGVQNWVGPGMVKYTFRCKDSIGQWSPRASGTVSIEAPPLPTGIITGPSACVVASGGTSCTVPLSWVTYNPVTTTSYIYRDDVAPSVASGLSGGPTNMPVVFANNTEVRIFTLLHNGELLATKTVTANCTAGEYWNEGVCTVGAPPPTGPVISVSPVQGINFRGMQMGSDNIEEFLVTNIGSAGSLLSGTTNITGIDFTCVYGCSYGNLALRTAPHPVGIKFRPTGIPGSRMGNIVFTGGGGTTKSLSGIALGIAPTGSLDFNNVVLRRTKTLELRVVNPSSSIDLGSGVFEVASPFRCIARCSYRLGPSSEHIFVIAFSPTERGTFTKMGTLSGISDSIFTITGNGVAPIWSFSER